VAKSLEKTTGKFVVKSVSSNRGGMEKKFQLFAGVEGGEIVVPSICATRDRESPSGTFNINKAKRPRGGKGRTNKKRRD